MKKNRNIKLKDKKVIISFIGVILTVILSTLTYFTYRQYEKTIVHQQQQNMLGISRSISRSIELFINDIKDSMKIISLDGEFIKKISGVDNGNDGVALKPYYEAHKDSINGIYFFNKDGELSNQYPKGSKTVENYIQANVDYVISSKKAYIANPYLDEEKNTFILNIYEPVFKDGEFTGVLSVGISLDVIYNKLIQPVKIGKKGYALVKNQYGIIIMHNVKEQVGMDVIETRKHLYPELDFEELEKLINDQLTGGEGTAIYHSYWWAESSLKKVKKLNAYTPVELGDYFWVVALTMSYDEVQEPINKFLAQIITIAVLIAIIISIFITALIKMKKNKEELEKETKYLKILNETSEQLREKEAELYHSSKLKMVGTFAGGIAHDINNLLTPILGYSELLLMRLPKGGEYYEDVEEILKASQKGKDLIEQILAFSRNDKSITNVEAISINQVTRETIKLIRTIIPKNIVIKENIEENCGYINANFTHVHQVIFNLCTNAYQAMKDLNGILEISLRNVKGSNISKMTKDINKDLFYAELVIKDSGCGMNEETQHRIFDPFFTTKPSEEGTGLGLFVVRNIIEKYKGAIMVESVLGKGSSFTVYLPLIDEHKEGEKFNSKRSHEHKRILIVDDNETVIKVLKKGLEHLGYYVISETEPRKAFGTFKREYENIDLVITDYMMPNMNGSELAKKLKEVESNIPIILISGYMDQSGNSIGEDKNINAYISKPVEINSLTKTIKELLF
ncbi:signal transduction histidine kinase [Clostridium punense]|uniref:Stage 0 sporulation protein A homolog n=1 Tax=Clostridium punense TaxID=1054297 RepID=A0ABS4JZL4_9CLOT|nr:sensor histidine kinase [Clostridium sp. BL8]EQB88137.1 hypothetical protein M918_05760 [Clostridium sp. BL8]MBP2020963.1 signal transduction histidine kinase [Clostridium punense]